MHTSKDYYYFFVKYFETKQVPSPAAAFDPCRCLLAIPTAKRESLAFNSRKDHRKVYDCEGNSQICLAHQYFIHVLGSVLCIECLRYV
jgi:hypothetical protein